MTTDKQLFGTLLSLDFTPNDAHVYLSLLKAGTTTAGPIIKDTGFHRNIVYTSLDHLIARKLVAEKTVRGRKRFTPTTPDTLTREYQEKASAAEVAASAISERLQSSPHQISIHEGNEEFTTLLLSLTAATEKQDELFVLGAGGESFIRDSLSKAWDEYCALLKQRKIRVKLLAYENQRDSITEHLSDFANYSVRFLDDYLENPSGTQVFPSIGAVLNLIYPDAQNPITVIAIQSEALASGQQQLFQNLWKVAKK